MSTTTRLTTAEELLRMPQAGSRYELVRGDLREMTPAGHEHGKLAMRLAARLFQHVEADRLGVVYAAETGFLLSRDPDTVRAPDVAFVSQQRVEETGEPEGYWPGPPDLAAGIVSPNDTYAQVEEKVLDWLNAGTRMVVVVNPGERTATVYRSRTEIAVLTGQDVLDGAGVVPGWRLPVSDLFA